MDYPKSMMKREGGFARQMAATYIMNKTAFIRTHTSRYQTPCLRNVYAEDRVPSCFDKLAATIGWGSRYAVYVRIAD